MLFKFRLWGVTKNIIIAPRENVPEVPFCHIAIASNLFVGLLDQVKSVFLYGWNEWGFYTLGTLYVFSTLGIGQAFCSWGCFYGGIDEGMSRINPKQLIPVNNVPRRLRDFPIGLWIFLMLAAIVLLEPVFCLWVCPLKFTTALLNKGDLFKYKMQIAIFASVGFVFLFALPLLIKKRTFCSFICPFGAFISVAGQVNPYRVRINEKKCEKCGDCIKACPMMAITPENKVLNYCVRCGKCIETCRNSAPIIDIRGRSDEKAYILFIMSVMLLGGTISSFFIPEAGIVILKLIGF